VAFPSGGAGVDGPCHDPDDHALRPPCAGRRARRATR
jgi:hypothetical protein